MTLAKFYFRTIIIVLTMAMIDMSVSVFTFTTLLSELLMLPTPSMYLNSPRLIKPFRTDGENYWIRELGTEMLYGCND
jgi:hypothetical protein